MEYLHKIKEGEVIASKEVEQICTTTYATRDEFVEGAQINDDKSALRKTRCYSPSTMSAIRESIENMSPNNSVKDSSFKEITEERCVSTRINKFSLVAFHNNELHIVDSKRIKQREGENCTVNFKGCFYAARLILSSASPFGKTRRVRWTSEEREAIESIFGDPTTLEKLPTFKQCADAVKHKCLNRRTPAQIKTWINNQQKKWQDST
ncbi:uncharacterized protein LOC105262122 isoform X2 [Musca domestica]|uniref:Uncharacterized protein LOC105262122 isoform X2 n=1 Tax=Musca domestica TaxID=7370 RepID=A0ABM3UZ97_MUSDO|nr:uncharacterized protein LOC105262122 isoform X2 [Musca domestica]